MYNYHIILNLKNIIKQGNIKKVCRHDYKNAIKIGNIDYQCPLCSKILDPCEWFLMNSFEFVDVEVVEENDKKINKPL